MFKQSTITPYNFEQLNKKWEENKIPIVKSIQKTLWIFFAISVVFAVVPSLLMTLVFYISPSYVSIFIIGWMLVATSLTDGLLRESIMCDLDVFFHSINLKQWPEIETFDVKTSLAQFGYALGGMPFDTNMKFVQSHRPHFWFLPWMFMFVLIMNATYRVFFITANVFCAMFLLYNLTASTTGGEITLVLLYGLILVCVTVLINLILLGGLFFVDSPLYLLLKEHHTIKTKEDMEKAYGVIL